MTWTPTADIPSVKVAGPRNGLPEPGRYIYGDPRRAEQVRRLRAAIAASEEAGPGPDDSPGPEWYRERDVENGHDWEPPAHVIPRISIDAAWPPAPGPATGPVVVDLRPAPPRCEACGYLTTAIGHKVACDG